MIRWADLNDSGNDHLLTVDDVVVTYTYSSVADTTPPVFAGGSPAASSINTTNFTLSSTINEVGKTYYVVLPDTTILAPSPAQVKAGQNAQGNAVALSGNFSNSTANTAATKLINGLTQSTNYKVYVVAEDLVPNLQATATKVEVTTATPAPAPTVSGFSPGNGVVGTLVTIDGTNFTNAATVTFNSTAATTVNFVSSTQLTAVVPTGATTGKISVTVGSSTGVSATDFTVDNPAPVLTGINPATRVAGSASFTLTASGSSFVSGSVITFNGAALTTTFVNNGQLTASVPASAIATVGTYDVTVTTPAPGGGTSAPQTFTVTAPPAILTASETALEGFVTAAGVASASKQYTLTASGLTAPITVTAPTGYQVSLSAGSGYAQQISVPQTGGTVYVIIGDAAPAGAANGTITNVSGGETQNVTVTGQVFAAGSSDCISTQGFESTTFPPTGWVASQVTRGTAAGDAKNGGAAATFGSTNAGTLTMPKMAYPVGVSFFLGRTSNNTLKTLEVEVSTTSQTSGFTSIFTFDHNNVPVSSYNFYSVDLSAYSASSQVWVRFRKTLGSTALWRLDDVTGYCAAPPAAPEINITQGATAVASGGSVSVASTAVGGTTPVSFTITNSGSASLQLNGTAPNFVVLSGTNAAEFSVTQQPTSPIGFAAGSNTSPFEVTFQPTSGGSKTATLTIANNDGDEGTYTITLNATATVPLASQPTAQPTVTVGSVTQTTAEITLAGGDGAKNLVVVRPASASAMAPADGSTYAGNLTYGTSGTGATTGTNNFVVVAGANAGPVTVTGLNAGTDYVVEVYAYNDNSTTGAENYLTTTPGSAPFSTVTAPIVATRWDGGGDGSSFADALNWSTDAVPTTGENVLLDHTYVTTAYTVTLPGVSSGLVSLGSLTINPNGGAAIRFVLPNTNTAPGYLRLTNATNALVIYSGGTFVNSSASTTTTSGTQPVDVTTGSANFIIYNGGTYQHNTVRSVSDLLDNLSDAAGTERGNFVYDIPSGSSSSPSLSGRTYGNLVLRSTVPASYTYSTTGGASPLTIKGDLDIASNVTFQTTLNNDVFIGGNLINLGRFRFAPSSLTSPRRLVLNGTTAQTISGSPLTQSNTGTSYLGFNVILSINNPAGVTLNASVVLNSLGYSSGAVNPNSGGLELLSGVLTTSSTNTLKLAAGAVLLPATPTASSFVNGPLLRELEATPATTPASSYLFPVGDYGIYRPITLNVAALSAATTFSVVQRDGQPASQTLTGDLTRVSRIRSFTVTPDVAPASFSGTITLTFGADDQVTDPAASTLVIAKNNGSGWVNIGRSTHVNNGSAGGSPYVAGTLTSDTFTSFSDFALASTAAENQSNPLPVTLTAFTAQRQVSGVLLKWATAQEKNSAYFEVLRSIDGRGEFRAVGRVQAAGHATTARQYSFPDAAAPAATAYYRLRQVDADGTAVESAIVTVAGAEQPQVLLLPNPAHESVQLSAAGPVQWRIIDALGRTVLQGQGNGSERIDLSPLRAGTYQVLIRTQQQLFTRRLLKVD